MIETPWSMTQLALILSALEGAPRNPNSKPTAMRAIARNAATLGLEVDDILAAAPGLLDGRLSAAAWRAQLTDEVTEPGVAAEAAPTEAGGPTDAAPTDDGPTTRPLGVRQELVAACRAAEHWLVAERERPGETCPDEILTVLRAAIARAESGGRAAKSGATPRAPRADSKEAQLIGMLRRPEGATIAQIVATTGWQQHTVRGAFAGALKRRRGLNVVSEKPQGGERVYRITE